jgi:hypothetical protein
MNREQLNSLLDLIAKFPTKGWFQDFLKAQLMKIIIKELNKRARTT